MKKRFRDAISGRFTKADAAAAHPHTTVAESIDTHGSVLAALRWRLADLEAIALEIASDLRMASPDSDVVLSIATRLEDAARATIPEEQA